MKKPPKEPIRMTNVERTYIIFEADSLESVTYNNIPFDAKFYINGDNIMLVWETPETDIEFDLRYKDYLKKLDAYNKWISSGEAEKEKQLADLETEQKELEAKLKIVQNKLAKVK